MTNNGRENVKPYIFKGPIFELSFNPGVFIQNVHSRASGKYLGHVTHGKEGWKFWRIGRFSPDKKVYKYRDEAAFALFYDSIEAQ